MLPVLLEADLDCCLAQVQQIHAAVHHRAHCSCEAGCADHFQAAQPVCAGCNGHTVQEAAAGETEDCKEPPG